MQKKLLSAGREQLAWTKSPLVSLVALEEVILKLISTVDASHPITHLAGVAQVTVLGPCTFLVTAAVTGDKSISLWQRTVMTFKTQGIGGFYHGGTALVLRQGAVSPRSIA